VHHSQGFYFSSSSYCLHMLGAWPQQQQRARGHGTFIQQQGISSLQHGGSWGRHRATQRGRPHPQPLSFQEQIHSSGFNTWTTWLVELYSILAHKGFSHHCCSNTLTSTLQRGLFTGSPASMACSSVISTQRVPAKKP